MRLAVVNTYTHPFNLPLDQTALLVIDMQNDFCHPDGFNGSELGLDMTAVRAIIPAVQTLVGWARQAGIQNIFTRLDKPAHSCFVDTALDQRLQADNITHLLIVGVTTQCCVLATYRHASDLGYYCLLLDDCCAAFDTRDHDATVHILQSEGGVLGWVAPSSSLLGIPDR